MKYLRFLLIIGLLYSCSKNNSDSTDNTITTGTVSGSIKAYNRSGNENYVYNDITVKLIDKNGNVSNGSVNNSGIFQFQNVLKGNVILAVSKPGYGFIDSVLFDHQKVADTLTNIDLLEDMPFSCQLLSVDYVNSRYTYSYQYDYQSTESYMVAEFFCFSKDPQVSINHNNLLFGSHGSFNVGYITGNRGANFGLYFNTFTNAGFKEGDKIYVNANPTNVQFDSSYFNQNRNYEVLHYKVGNASNIVSFTLHQ